jgi:hypothetical protein
MHFENDIIITDKVKGSLRENIITPGNIREGK